MVAIAYFRGILWIFFFTFATSEFWSKVFVEDSWLSGIIWLENAIVPMYPATLNSMVLTTTCGRHTWCLLACLLSSNEIHLSSVMVSPFYNNASEGLECYTKLKKDFTKRMSSNVHQTQMTSSPFYGPRDPDNLLSIYNGAQKYCFQANTSPYWLLIDLGKVENIKRILFTTHSGISPEHSPIRTSIKIGNESQSDGDFSSYKLFATVKGPLTLGVTHEIKSSKKNLAGRFISVEEVGNTKLLVCHIDIF